MCGAEQTTTWATSTIRVMPDQFVFLSLNDFKKLTSNERQAYLEKVARYVGALKDDMDQHEAKGSSPLSENGE